MAIALQAFSEFVLFEGAHTVSTLFSGSTIFACTAIITLAKPFMAILSIAMIFLCSPAGVHSMDTPFHLLHYD